MGELNYTTFTCKVCGASWTKNTVETTEKDTICDSCKEYPNDWCPSCYSQLVKNKGFLGRSSTRVCKDCGEEWEPEDR